VAALVGVQAGVVALGLHVTHRRARHELRGAGQLDGDHLVLAARLGHRLHDRAGAALQDPVDGRGQPLRAQRLEQVVLRPDLVGVDGAVVVGGHEHHRGRHGHRGEHPGQLHAVQARHPDVEEHHLDVGPLGHAGAGGHVQRPPRGTGRGLADALAAVEDAQRVGGVRRGEHRADARFLPEQVGEFLESGRLVVHGEDDQAAGAVVAVHDLLILHGRFDDHRPPW
jgi:hypothetical protein